MRSFYDFVHFSCSLFYFYLTFFIFRTNHSSPSPLLLFLPTFPLQLNPPSASQKVLGLPWEVYTVCYIKLRQNQAPLPCIVAKQFPSTGNELQEASSCSVPSFEILIKIKSHHFSSTLLRLLSNLSYAFPSTLKLVASFLYYCYR